MEGVGLDVTGETSYGTEQDCTNIETFVRSKPIGQYLRRTGHDFVED